MVEGRLQTREWEAKDGQRRNVVEVVAERVQFLGRPKGAAVAAATEGAGAGDSFEEPGGQADDVPF
jgi:single-strand DNA-binding protein